MTVGITQPDLKVSKEEKRSLAQWPIWNEREDLKGFFGSVSKYTADQFGFRENLIVANSKLKWLLGYSPSEGVIRGKEDWLFLKNIDPLLSQHKYGKAEVEDRLRKRAENVRTMETELGKRGIVYQHIIASNKMTVYKEYLPAKFSLTDISASYHFYQAQFTEAEFSKKVVSDRVLGAHKSKYQYPFYFKNDSHWNHLGAYLVFKESLDKLSQLAPNLEFDTPVKKFLVDPKPARDLASRLSLGRELASVEPKTNFRPCARRKGITSVGQGINQSICKRNSTVVLMIGDSFQKYLVPFYSESIGHMYMVTQSISRQRLFALVDQLKPDLVIEEVVERHLPALVPQ